MGFLLLILETKGNIMPCCIEKDCVNSVPDRGDVCQKHGTLVRLANGEVHILFPRRFWQLWKFGWHRHETFFGRKCWIRYKWTKEDLEKMDV